MLTAKHIMAKDVITVSPETESGRTEKLLLENRINGVPVTDAAGNLVLGETT